MAKVEVTERVIAENRRARYDYFIEERIEAGLALEGWEVKSMRAGNAQLAGPSAAPPPPPAARRRS